MASSQYIKYFAYASNLLVERVLHTVGKNSQAKVIGPALLKDYDLCFDYYSEEWKGCKATSRVSPGHSIWGLLWQVTEDDRVKLARAEEVHLGKYHEINLEITSLDGATHSCFAYQLAKTMDPNGLPSPQYKDVIIRGAIQAQLPQEYIDVLRHKPDNGHTGRLQIYEEILQSMNVGST